jgi:hypothetical protein
MWQYHGERISLESYHGVPEGWHAREILEEHRRLGGAFDLGGPEACEPGAPSWMPDRYEWLQYRQAMYRVADGLLVDDAACVELAVRFIELRYIGSYSGFIRSLLSRRLKHCALTQDQRQRLHAHFSALAIGEDRCDEFRDYIRLWRRFISPEQTQELAARLKAQSNGEARAKWLLSTLSPAEPVPRKAKPNEREP